MVTIPIPTSDTPSRSAAYGGVADPTSVTLPSFQIFAKPLNHTAVAVFAVNHAPHATPVTVAFASVPGLAYAPGASVELYNIWTQASLGLATTQWNTTLASHDSAFLIINTALAMGSVGRKG